MTVASHAGHSYSCSLPGRFVVTTGTAKAQGEKRTAVLGGMMRHIVEYSAWVGAGWLASDALFIIVWCWFHSPNRPWMQDPDRTPTAFKLHTFETETGHSFGMLTDNGISMHKAS
jgi:hypothetical protein